MLGKTLIDMPGEGVGIWLSVTIGTVTAEVGVANTETVGLGAALSTFVEDGNTFEAPAETFPEMPAEPDVSGLLLQPARINDRSRTAISNFVNVLFMFLVPIEFYFTTKEELKHIIYSGKFSFRN